MSCRIVAAGACTAAGVGVAAAEKASTAGTVLIKPAPVITVGSRSTTMAALTPASAFVGLSARERRRLPRATQMALVAVRDLVHSSEAGCVPTDCAVIIGTTFGNAAEYADAEKLPLVAGMFAVPNSIATVVSEEIRSTATSMALSTACSSGLEVLNVAEALLAAGRARSVLCVCVDALYTRRVVEGFVQIGAISTSASDPADTTSIAEGCRPFDLDRNGFVMGEAACAVLLEAADADRSCDASLGTVRSVATATDWSHPVNPDEHATELVRLMRRSSIADLVAGGRLHLVATHGSATRANDASESAALNQIGYEGPSVGFKGCLGHTMAASGLLELVLLCTALRTGQIPPTPGFSRADPACGAHVSHRARNLAKVDHERNGAKLAAAIGGQLGAAVVSWP